MVEFKLGRTVVTAGVGLHMKEDTDFSSHVKECMDRHCDNDWGDVHHEDEGINDYAVENGDRILSVYKHENHPKIWIITEADRSATTVLFPDEY